MFKLLLITIPIAAIIGTFVYFIFFYNQSPKQVALSGFDKIQPQTLDSLNSRVQSLEDKISTLNLPNKSSSSNNVPAPSLSPNSTDLTLRVTNMEKVLTDLQIRIAKLEQATPAPSAAPASTSNKYPLYIPLGTGGQVGDKNWNSPGSYQVSINTSDYSGYKNMQIEVNAQMIQSVGQGNFRLFNSSDNSAVSGSDTSITSSSLVWVSSGGFTLPSGSKTYVLQIQSTQGYNVNLQSARIKVNF